MKLDAALASVTRLFLDTAPVIYYVEQHPRYFPIVVPIFDRIDNDLLIAVTSPVTLAECLIVPYRRGLNQLRQDFNDLIVYGYNTMFTPIDYEIAQRAAEFRAQHNLTLPDALQIAVALAAGCEVLLTNDVTLRRVAEIQMLVLDELELD